MNRAFGGSMSPIGLLGKIWAPRDPGCEEAAKVAEVIAHEWTSLRTLWDIASTNPGLTADDKAAIDARFPPAPPTVSGPAEWVKLNEASQIVGRYLLPEQLDIEYPILLSLAARRGLSNLDVHKKSAEFFEPNANGDAVANGAAQAAKKCLAYLALLDDLQRDFIDTRNKRELRKEVARRLLGYGCILLVVAVLPFVILAVIATWQAPATGPGTLYSSNPVFGFGLVMAFGLLGAFFSRVTQFQTDSPALSFDQVMNSYRPDVLRVRLLVGMMGAMVFYFLMRSGIVGGTIFPKLSDVSLSTVSVLQEANGDTTVASSKPEASGLTILLPSTELAKLLVWSFLAGFSERLVRNTLDTTVAKAEQAKP